MTPAQRFVLCAAVALTACGAPNHGTFPQNNPSVAATTGGFALTPASFTRDEAPPIALTTPDGDALKLSWIEAKAVVDGPLAFTELHLGFDNPDTRTIEGRFRIALPDGASVSRFAMKIDNRWQEGEVVEKQRARRVYEDFLHRRIDPALLEQGPGNTFTARVFPIAANQHKELIISYSQEVTGDQQTLVPLQGLPQLERLDVSVANGRGETTTKLQHASYVPEGNFIVGRGLTGSHGLRSGNLMVARVEAMTNAAPQPLGATLVLMDTSASRALELDAQLGMVLRIAKRVATRNPDTKLVVAAFDQAIFPVFAGNASALSNRHIEPLRARRALGASDLQAALRWANTAAEKHRCERVVLLTDGVVTAGDDGRHLLAAARSLRTAGVKRLDAIVYGGIRDVDALNTLVTAGLSQDGIVVDGSDVANILRRLELATRSGLKVKVDGARWWWPQELHGVQPGDEVLIHAELPSSKDVDITLAGEQATGLTFASAPRPLLERSWARAKIDSLLDHQRRNGASSELRARIVALSTQHRVVSPYTSLLVLERQADYDRFNIAREALSDILTITGGKLDVVDRPAPAAAQKPNRTFARPQAATNADRLSARGNMWGDGIGDSFGAGGLGLSGIGEGGGGRGEGIGLSSIGTIGHGVGPSSPTEDADSAPPLAPPPPVAATGQGFGSGSGRAADPSHRARPPQVRHGSTSVSGRLPPEVIQRIVRQNFGRLRRCYERGLVRNPRLRGRVVVRFTIGQSGAVTDASGRGDLGDTMIGCVTRMFTQLRFPSPVGGRVTVSYPVVFTPDGSASQPVQPPPQIAPALASRQGLPSRQGPAVPPRPAPARPYRGNFASVMTALAEGRVSDALVDAQNWQAKDPSSVLAIVALGEALEASDKAAWAARAYGSIIDMYPSRADLRRYAGERLDRVAHTSAIRLSNDTYAKAKAQRPDHPTSHRLLGYSLLRRGRYGRAFDAVAAGLAVATGRFVGADPILRADLGLIAAAWLRALPNQSSVIHGKLAEHGTNLAVAPSLRFVLNWETDANDVDLHVYDMHGGHASYQQPSLESGGQLLGDVTSGYGPELFEIPGRRRSAGYLLQAHYYSRGPMGYGMGKVQIIKHDGKGKLEIDERPFMVMVDRAFVDLGTVGHWRPSKG